jgi:hypothetical protein
MAQLISSMCLLTCRVRCFSLFFSFAGVNIVGASNWCDAAFDPFRSLLKELWPTEYPFLTSPCNTGPYRRQDDAGQWTDVRNNFDGDRTVDYCFKDMGSTGDHADTLDPVQVGGPPDSSNAGSESQWWFPVAPSNTGYLPTAEALYKILTADSEEPSCQACTSADVCSGAKWYCGVPPVYTENVPNTDSATLKTVIQRELNLAYSTGSLSQFFQLQRDLAPCLIPLSS